LLTKQRLRGSIFWCVLYPKKEIMRFSEHDRPATADADKARIYKIIKQNINYITIENILNIRENSLLNSIFQDFYNSNYV
jgi:hypothetical protein